MRSGDLVAEVETDKATMEIEAAEDGVIEKLLLAEGTDHVPVNHPIALLRVEDEVAPPAATGQPRPEAAAPRPEAARTSSSTVRAPSPTADVTAEAVLHRIAEQISGKRPACWRRWRRPHLRLAARAALRARDWAQADALAGSGPRGRIVKADVRARRTPTRCGSPNLSRRRSPGRGPGATPRGPAPARAHGAPATGPSRSECPTHKCSRSTSRCLQHHPARHDAEDHRRRLTLPKQTIPHFYLAHRLRISTRCSPPAPG